MSSAKSNKSSRRRKPDDKTPVAKLVKQTISSAADTEKTSLATLLVPESKIKQNGSDFAFYSPNGSIAGSQTASAYGVERNSVYTMHYGDGIQANPGSRPIAVKLQDSSKRKILAPSVAGSSVADINISSATSISSLGYQRNSFLAAGGGVTERTMKELVEEIEKCAKLKQEAPYFVPKLDELSPEFLYWNKTGEKMKIPQRKRFHQKEKKEPKKTTKKPKSRSNVSSGLEPDAVLGTSTSLGQLPTPKTPKTLVSGRSGKGDLASSRSCRAVSAGKGLHESVSADAIDTSIKEEQHQQQISLRPNRPKPNIIGCLNPVELVLARADERSRKQTHALELREKACQEQIAAIDKIIQSKQSRSEKYAAEIVLQQRQCMWLKILNLALYSRHIVPCYEAKWKKYGTTVEYFESTLKITRFLINCYKNRLHKKMAEFMRILQPRKHRFIMSLRIWRKRRATCRLKDYLLACKKRGPQKMTVVIHRFVKSVKFLQKVSRDFIACKQGRISALLKLWDKLEYRYIKSVLEKRKANQAQIVKEAATEIVDNATKAEMLKQSTRWAQINDRMEQKIFELQLLGELRKTTEEETILKLAIDRDVKITYVTKIVEQLRKEVLLKQQEIDSKFINKRKEFTHEDALALLKGHTDHINKVVNAKFAKVDIKRKSEGFILYKVLDCKSIFNKVKESHDRARTFHIEINAGRKRKDKSSSVVGAESNGATSSSRSSFGGIAPTDNKHGEATAAAAASAAAAKLLQFASTNDDDYAAVIETESSTAAASAAAFLAKEGSNGSLKIPEAKKVFIKEAVAVLKEKVEAASSRIRM